MEPIAGYLSACFGIAGSIMLAVPYIRRQADRDADLTLSEASLSSNPLSEAYKKMITAIRTHVIRSAIDDFKWGTRGCVALALAFLFLLGQMVGRYDLCAGRYE